MGIPDRPINKLVARERSQFLQVKDPNQNVFRGSRPRVEPNRTKRWMFLLTGGDVIHWALHHGPALLFTTYEERSDIRWMGRPIRNNYAYSGPVSEFQTLKCTLRQTTGSISCIDPILVIILQSSCACRACTTSWAPLALFGITIQSLIAFIIVLWY